MPNFQDLTGIRFGRLVVIERLPSINKHTIWLCRCDCGVEKGMHMTNIKRYISCGCYQKEVQSINARTHGLSKTRIYKIWKSMRARCTKKTLKAYVYYGGRGISVCERWDNSFDNFYNDMIATYSDTLTLDRIDVNGNYELSNCRWITQKEQSRNTRRNHYVTINGETKCLSEWLEQSPITACTLRRRIRRGWSYEDALLKQSIQGQGSRPKRNKICE